MKKMLISLVSAVHPYGIVVARARVKDKTGTDLGGGSLRKRARGRRAMVSGPG